MSILIKKSTGESGGSRSLVSADRALEVLEGDRAPPSLAHDAYREIHYLWATGEDASGGGWPRIFTVMRKPKSTP